MSHWKRVWVELIQPSNDHDAVVQRGMAWFRVPCSTDLSISTLEARMEDVLDLYAEKPDLKRPVVCFDESPTQLIGEVREPIPARPRQLERFDCEYRRNRNHPLARLPKPRRGEVGIARRRCAGEQRLDLAKLVAKDLVGVMESLTVALSNRSQSITNESLVCRRLHKRKLENCELRLDDETRQLRPDIPEIYESETELRRANARNFGTFPRNHPTRRNSRTVWLVSEDSNR